MVTPSCLSRRILVHTSEGLEVGRPVHLANNTCPARFEQYYLQRLTRTFRTFCGDLAISVVAEHMFADGAERIESTMTDLRQTLLKRCSELHKAVGRRDTKRVARILKDIKEGHRNHDHSNTSSPVPVPELDYLCLGATALHVACATEQPQMVSALLNAGANVNAVRPSDGYTALNMAAETKQRDIAKILLEAGADPDIPNIERVSPLHFAAQLGDAGIAADLLDAGADQMQPTLGKNLRPIHFASFVGRPDIVELLVEAAPKSAPAGFGNLARTVLLEVGDARGQRPLHCAVQGSGGGPETVETLLRLGADVDGHANPRGLTPLMLAAMKLLPTIAKVLIEVGGADVNVANDHGETILHMSARMCDPATSALLIRAGADLSAKDLDGRDAAACVKMPPTPIRPPHLVLPKEADIQAYLRLLERAPAYRASSWRWPACISSDPSSRAACPPPSSSSSTSGSGTLATCSARLNVSVCRRRSSRSNKRGKSREKHDDNEMIAGNPMSALWRYVRP